MPEGAVKEGYIKGSLTQTPFPKILNFINQAGKSGILALSQGKRKVHIHFDRGEIVYVTSSFFPEMSLGEHLLKEGKITQQVHEESIENTRNDNVKQGSWLVEKGYISPHDLYEALHTQVMRKLFKLFSWVEGEFFFREGEIINEEHRILNISFPNLLYRGIRSHLPLDKPPTEFRGRKEDLLVKRFAGRYRIEDLKLGPAETRIFNLVNGERTVRQIVSLANVSKAAAYKVLYALFLLELVGFPEAFRSDRISKQTKEKRVRAAPTAEGFEIRIDSDVIAEAMASVDRIRDSVRQDEAEGTAAAPAPSPSTPVRPAQAAPAPSPSTPTPVKPAPAQPSPVFSFADAAAATVQNAPDPWKLDAPPKAAAAPPAPDFSTAKPRPAEPEPTTPPPAAGKSADPFAQFAPPEPAAPASPAAPPAANPPPGAESHDKLLMEVDDYTNAADLIKQAHYLIDDRNWTAARRFLTRALELDENNADAYALLGWTVFNDPSDPEGRAEGERIVKKGLKMAPGRYLHFLYLGKIYAAQEQYDFAELHFVKALQLNVECGEAREEMKRIRNL